MKVNTLFRPEMKGVMLTGNCWGQVRHDNSPLVTQPLYVNIYFSVVIHM